MNKAEITVRNYLLYIKNPSALIDRDAVALKKIELKDTEDPIQRLHLVSELKRLEHPDNSELEQAFISVAKEWGRENGISFEAFRAEGVSNSVLAQAGYPTVVRETAKTQRRRRSRVSSKVVRAAFSKEPFSIKDITEATGASSGMVRKVILEAVDENILEQTGKDPRHAGPGRARLLYKLV